MGRVEVSEQPPFGELRECHLQFVFLVEFIGGFRRGAKRQVSRE